MRGGKSLVDRGMIPRMLSNIYRKSRALEKSSGGETTVDVSMSYYEIYNDKVFDLFEAPEKRTPTGLPIREAEGGKTVVAGLSEVPCSTLKDFELLYDKANSNRSVGATKLNAQSSRSHAILCVKVTISTAAEIRSSTVCAIDLAGSEDNRRTGNVKDRMVESASINKSLFVLAQCVEAISKKQARIPYRESKMTRILSLGQNNGLTVMILNLAPTIAFHLDTLSSLNFANRTKKIEVREVENEPIFKGPPRSQLTSTVNGGMPRQPLRPLNNATNVNILANRDTKTDKEKPAKAFSVYADKTKHITANTTSRAQPQKHSPLKRTAIDTLSSRPTKQSKPTPSTTSFLRRGPPETQTISKATLESLVEKKVAEILAQRQANDAQPVPQAEQTEREKAISAEVQARLDSIEKRLEGQEGERAEGLSYLFMAKQHQARGEDGSALRMYELARPFFPGNEKLERKIEKLRIKQTTKRQSRENFVYQDSEEVESTDRTKDAEHVKHKKREASKRKENDDEAEREQGVKAVKRRKQQIHQDFSVDADESYQASEAEASYHDNSDSEKYASDESTHKSRRKASKKQSQPKPAKRARASSPDPLCEKIKPELEEEEDTFEKSGSMLTPRTRYLIDVLNSRSVSKLKGLNGLGVKKAEAIVDHLEEHEREVGSWNDVLGLDVRGIGKKSWETMREGVLV